MFAIPSASPYCTPGNIILSAHLWTLSIESAGRLDRVLRFSRQFRSLRARAHGTDVFGGNITTTNKLLLLSRFTEFTFCLEISDKRKPRNELRSIEKVFLKLTGRKVDKPNFQQENKGITGYVFCETTQE